MKNEYPIQLIELRFQVDHITPKKIQLFEEFNTDPLNVNTRIFVIKVRHRQIEMISDGKRNVENKVLQNYLYSYLYLGILTNIQVNCFYKNLKILIFKDFMEK